MQNSILREAVKLAKENAKIGYVTCSLFEAENMSQVNSFLSNQPDWMLVQKGAFLPRNGTDGFFYAEFERQSV